MAVATGHRVSVRCTVTEDNIGCMEKLVAFCGELGCSRVCFCPVNVEPGSDYRLLDKLPEPSVYADSWLKALQWTAGAIELLEPTLAIIGTPTLRECPSIFILPDGTALAAGVDSVNSPSLQLGNILHDDRHALVERTAAVHAFYRTNARRGCAACNLQYLCCGSLLANRYKAGEATQAGQDYVCQIARSLVAVILPMLLKRAKPIPLPRSFPPDVALFKYRPFFGLMKEDWCGAR
jgi:radical SAM protein with 4Fe4S-binding SPASM domain